jgi:hypothetical protein
MTFSNCAVVCGEMDIPFDQVHRGSTGPLQTSVDERKRDKLDETYGIQPYADPSRLQKPERRKMKVHAQVQMMRSRLTCSLVQNFPANRRRPLHPRRQKNQASSPAG